MTEMPDDAFPLPDRKPADVDVANRLIATQFPQWSHLDIRPVGSQGWDNRTFRLGEEMLVRLPTATEYAAAVEKEHQWLPVLAATLPLKIPVPLAKGLPDENFPHDWSVYRWINGEPADRSVVNDMTALAVNLAEFLRCLQQTNPTGGPPPGLHNWFRAGPRQALPTVGRRHQRPVLLHLRNVCDHSGHPAWDFIDR